MVQRSGIPRDRQGRHVRLMEYMLASAAWQSLDTVARALYVEMARRYRGPNSNNGKIPYSVREAAVALHVSRSTSNRGFHHLRGTRLHRRQQTQRLFHEGSRLQPNGC